MLRVLVCLFLIAFQVHGLVTPLSVSTCKQPVPTYRPLPSLREQDKLEHRWLEERYAFVPKVLEKYGYDAYIITQREYAEDTLFKSLVSSTTTFSARRRTLYLFHTLKTNETDVPNPLLLIDNTPAIWDDVKAALDKIDPKRIAVNIDKDLAFGDGLHTGEGLALLSHLPPTYLPRISSNHLIPVEIIAARVGGDEQLGMYRQMMENVWDMVVEGFSERVVEVGRTNCEDLEWWFRERMQEMGVKTWFHPTVTAYNLGQPIPRTSPFEPGHLLHVDIGITALNMNTDTQHLGYILKKGETDVPEGLKKGLRNANRLQGLVREQMGVGKTGDEVLRSVRKRMREEGLEGTIYCHPIGDYGHSAGPLIGMTNLQDSVPVGGSLPFFENTWFSVELSGETKVPEWGNVTQVFQLEEDVAWNAKTSTWDWVYGHQTEFHVVRQRKSKVDTAWWRKLFLSAILA